MTSAPEAAAVRRRLAGRPDPLMLYRALTNGGKRDTALFESEEGVSLLMVRAAMRIECRGEIVTLSALTANGRTLLALAAERLSNNAVATSSGRLTVRYPRSYDHDADESLIAPAPLHALRAVTNLAADGFSILALGIIAFDYVAQVEGIDGGNQADPLDFPDFVFWVPDSLILFDGTAAPEIMCLAFGPHGSRESEENFHDAVDRLAALTAKCEDLEVESPKPSPSTPKDSSAVDLDDEHYCEIVRRLRQEIAAGEVYQIVPSRIFSHPCHDPLAAFTGLREVEESAYRYFVDAGDWTLFGASPETSVRVSFEGGERRIGVRPIAGTRPRGATADEDDRMEAELRLDAKELGEHMMLVDLARNDVARVSRPATRCMDRLLSIKRHARVMHLESSVSGVLREELDALDALTACLNVGTLVGAPKRRATELLLETEATRRGPYGGAIGWIGGDSAMDTAVVIRSALVKDGIAYVRAGAGVVHDSDPQAEADETRRKAATLLSVLECAGQAA